MITIRIQKTEFENVELSEESVNHVVIEYIKKVLGGEGFSINSKGKLEHWESYPHGSGTTTNMGDPTPLQKAAWNLLLQMSEAKKNANAG